jgi:hypothetical protein
VPSNVSYKPEGGGLTMANTDYRLKVGFVDHPKVEKLVRLLGDSALRNLLRLFEYAALNRPMAT